MCNLQINLVGTTTSAWHGTEPATTIAIATAYRIFHADVKWNEINSIGITSNEKRMNENQVVYTQPIHSLSIHTVDFVWIYALREHAYTSQCVSLPSAITVSSSRQRQRTNWEIVFAPNAVVTEDPYHTHTFRWWQKLLENLSGKHLFSKNSTDKLHNGLCSRCASHIHSVFLYIYIYLVRIVLIGFWWWLFFDRRPLLKATTAGKQALSVSIVIFVGLDQKNVCILKLWLFFLLAAAVSAIAATDWLTELLCLALGVLSLFSRIFDEHIFRL